MSPIALRPAALAAAAMIEAATPTQATEAEPARLPALPCGSVAPESLTETVGSVLEWIASRRASQAADAANPPSCTVRDLRLVFSRPARPGHQEASAIFHRRQMVVALPRDWTQHDPSDMGLLVHELVHVVQAAAGRFERCGPDCRRRLEREAYAAQARWLEEHGYPMLALMARIEGMYATEPVESFTYR